MDRVQNTGNGIRVRVGRLALIRFDLLGVIYAGIFAIEPGSSRCTFRADREPVNVDACERAFVSAHVEILMLVLLDENGAGPCARIQIAFPLRRFAL
ncbi:hypothetical protein BDR04DRAFT_1092757 [Suillus decipiens]|nr:hypothetical protein BDR04DRAFT_1092757 [Suillus decipiens]